MQFGSGRHFTDACDRTLDKVIEKMRQELFNQLVPEILELFQKTRSEHGLGNIDTTIESGLPSRLVVLRAFHKICCNENETATPPTGGIDPHFDKKMPTCSIWPEKLEHLINMKTRLDLFSVFLVGENYRSLSNPNIATVVDEKLQEEFDRGFASHIPEDQV